LKYRVEDGRTIVFCGNIHSGASYRLENAMEALLAGEDVDDAGPPSIVVRPVAAELLRTLCGEYQMRPGTTLDIQTDGALLYSSEWPMFPLGERRFYSLQDYGTVEFVLAEDGSVERLDWYWTGAENAMPMPRVE
jgi:hypothetical protein